MRGNAETFGFQLLTRQLKTLLSGLGSFCLGSKEKTTDKVTISILITYILSDLTCQFANKCSYNGW